ncbi:MAG: exodeoxyribonuclease III [Pseudomonadota bacterium]
MKIVTWNINSVRLRAPLIARVMATLDPDILCLQETKCPDAFFPHQAMEQFGFKYRHIWGMKGYNGVAILSKVPFSAPQTFTRAGRDDCRHIAVTFPDFTLHNLYIPAGGDIPDRLVNDKFGHKLDYVRDMTDILPTLHGTTDNVILVGDFNIAPLEHDVWSHKQLLTVVSHTPIEVQHLNDFQTGMGWVDAIRHFVPPQQKCYTWWSYRNRDWRQSNRGRRLDHIWVSRSLKSRLAQHKILVDARDWPQTSDHVPVCLTLS